MGARAGIDLGGTKIQAVVVDGRNRVTGQARRPTPAAGGPAAVIEGMAEAVREAASGAGLDGGTIVGVGVGSPGTADVTEGTVSQALNVSPDWVEPVPLAAQLREMLGAPVKLGNDVEVATNAEYRLGAGRPYRSLLGVFWGTGVGGGLVLGGKSWTGRGAAGEIGHMVVKRGGSRCTCGRRGCLEAYAGRAAMERRARRELKKGRRSTRLFEIMEERGKPRLTSGIWARALDADDELAEYLIERAVRALGAGIASAVNLLDVEAVILGGGLGVRLGDTHLERIAKAMEPHLFAADRPPALHVAELGDLGGAIGAALLIPSRPSRKRSPSRAARARPRTGAPA
ncbi:MAG TPA: ROK family protein [Thermoleophilaceae bacterium]|nr:ROK family protein [Thermoleophilaceae bacterium]